MFQASRAILFHDGVVEKSHACVVAYNQEQYSSILRQNMIHWLDSYRLERHESFYLSMKMRQKMHLKNLKDF